MIEETVPPRRRALRLRRSRPIGATTSSSPQESSPQESSPPQDRTPALPTDYSGKKIDELRFPAGSVLMVAGIPGAGKSTLIHRLFDGPAAQPNTVVLDSADVRATLARRFGRRVPYNVYRPAVHTLHYARIAAWTLLGPPRDLVVHECGTRDWARRTVARLAAVRGREAHLLFLDTSPEQALAGQRSRGRVVRTKAFVRHSHSWVRLRSAIDEAAATPAGTSSRARLVRRVTGAPSLRREGWTSARSITRDQAAALTSIHFG